MRCGAYSQRHNPIMQPRKRCDLGKRNLFGYAAKISLTKGGFRKGTLLRADRTATFADGSPIRAPAPLVRHHDRSPRSFLNWDGGSGQNSRWSIILGNATLELSHRGNSPWRGPLRRRHASGPRKWRAVPLQASAGRRYVRMLRAETVGNAPFGASSSFCACRKLNITFQDHAANLLAWGSAKLGHRKMCRESEHAHQRPGSADNHRLLVCSQTVRFEAAVRAAPRVRSLTAVRRESREWLGLACCCCGPTARRGGRAGRRSHHRQSGEELG
jgi:hypothetical protein